VSGFSRTWEDDMGSKWVAGGILTVVFAAGAAAGAVAQQQASQTRREPQFENEQVRVWKSIIMPNQPLSLHRHEHGRTIVALKGGTLDVVDGKGQTKTKMNWESGKAYWLDVDPAGEQHGDLNKGKEPMEVIVVEMRK
jgi:quercetin dioxygenase-like cupin family protein